MNLLKAGGKLSIIVAIIIFGLLILFHELGHFLVAKKNGIKVEEFCIGMGPRLVHVTKGETIYSIRLFPIGGACMMEGEDESSTSSRAFNNKSVWARIAVVFAGPAFNFILAFFLASIIIGIGGAQVPTLSQVEEGTGAQVAGLQAGDTILKLDNKKITIFSDISLYLQKHPSGESVTVTYERDGQKNEVEVTPVKDEATGMYKFGFISARTKVGFFSTLRYGLSEVRYWIEAVIQSLGMLISGKVGAQDLSGPIRIVNELGTVYKESQKINVMTTFLNLANFSVLLSANLGVMNLLPIPALDGGRLLFLLIEAIRGKKMSANKEGMIHFVGFCALMVLMVFLFANDIRMLWIQ